MMHKNVAYNGLRFFCCHQSWWRGGLEWWKLVVLCAWNYIEAGGFFLYKNTPSMRAAKIIKNIPMIIV